MGHVQQTHMSGQLSTNLYLWPYTVHGSCSSTFIEEADSENKNGGFLALVQFAWSVFLINTSMSYLY